MNDWWACLSDLASVHVHLMERAPQRLCQRDEGPYNAGHPHVWGENVFPEVSEDASSPYSERVRVLATSMMVILLRVIFTGMVTPVIVLSVALPSRDIR